jgi:hypothetical protein
VHATSRGKELGVNGIVFGPGGLDGAGEGKDVLGVEAVIIGRSGVVPVATVFYSLARVVAEKSSRIGAVRGAANVLETPGEGADETVIIRLPAACFVAMNAAREPVHGKLTANSLPLSVRRENLGSRFHFRECRGKPEDTEKARTC